MLIPALLLLSLGLVVIYSSDPALAVQQLIFGLVGILLYLMLVNFDYRTLKSFIKPSYITIILLLIITFIIGFETRGSYRWIPLGPFNLQSSEFAKPVLILALAYFWSKNTPSWRNIFISFLVLLPIGAMIFRQPDLGTTLTLIFIWLVVLIASNISLKKIIILSLVGLLVLPVSWFGLQDYQKQRIYSFLAPTQDPQGIGFHVIQSTIAVGSGQFMGRGLGRGTQSRLQFLPEFRTDFIFAFVAEELGFLGSFIVLGLYMLLFLMMIRLLVQAKDRFGELVVVGVLGMLFFQVTVNIGMNVGLLPITGITLPLLSYGGSSVITTLISLGLVESFRKFGLKKREVSNFGLQF